MTYFARLKNRVDDRMWDFRRCQYERWRLHEIAHSTTEQEAAIVSPKQIHVGMAVKLLEEEVQGYGLVHRMQSPPWTLYDKPVRRGERECAGVSIFSLTGPTMISTYARQLCGNAIHLPHAAIRELLEEQLAGHDAAREAGEFSYWPFSQKETELIRQLAR